jgi:hypothetical protein
MFSVWILVGLSACAGPPAEESVSPPGPAAPAARRAVAVAHLSKPASRRVIAAGTFS